MTSLIQTFAGNVGIGTNDPGSFKLNVNGSVKATSLEVNGVENAQVPIGLISIWYGAISAIPTGWCLCNGQTIAKTDGSGNIVAPDLRGELVRGAHGDSPATNFPGQSGGANSMTLATAQLASHSHTITTAQANANHGHNTVQANANHSHNTTAANAPHGHSAANAPHGHSAANAPHGHNTAAANALHAHNYQVRQNDGGVEDVFNWNGGASKASNRLTNAGTGQANAPHAHGVNGNNAPHAHGVPAENAPHGHGVPAEDAPHAHNSSAGNTGQGSAIDIQNPYFVLAYIMKH
jgi:microcystin-dependent protein